MASGTVSGMDALDERMVTEVRRNGRVHGTDVARAAHRAVTTVFDRWPRTMQVVSRFASLLAMPRAGVVRWGWFRIGCRFGVQERLVSHPFVNIVLRDQGGFWVEGCFPSDERRDAFLADFRPEIVAPVIDEVCRERFLSLWKHWDCLGEDGTLAAACRREGPSVGGVLSGSPGRMPRSCRGIARLERGAARVREAQSSPGPLGRNG